VANIKGQETRVDIISALQGPEPGLSGTVKSADLQDDIEGLSEGFLGGLTEKKDNIFTGVSGNIEALARSADVFNMKDRIKLASQNRLPGEKFDLVFTFTFELGGTRRVLVSDAKISNFAISNSSRKDYVTFKFDFAADDSLTLPSPI